MKHSIKKQVIAFCLALIVCMSAMLAYTLWQDRLFEQRYHQIIQRDNEFMAFYSLLSEADHVFFQYSTNPTETQKALCEATVTQLDDAASALALHFDTSWSRDMQLLTTSYTESITAQLLPSPSNTLYTQTSLGNTLLTVNFRHYSGALQANAEAAYAVIEREQTVQQRWIVGILLVLVIGTVLLSVHFATRLLRPVEGLAALAQAICAGQEIAPSVVQGTGEVRALSEGFNHMLATIGVQMTQLKQQAQLETRLRQTEKQQLNAQLQTLQARINPHFLFNTLSVANELAWQEGAKQTSLMLEQTASYLRFTLDHLGQMVPLRAEFENIQNYFAILGRRFGERIGCEAFCSPEASQAAVPAMILQPLVENAYKHGVGMMTQGGWIHVTALRQDDTVVLRVQDNGAGMPQARVQALQASLQADRQTEPLKGIGLENIVRRIRQQMQCEVLLRIDSAPGQGTSIQITLPYVAWSAGGTTNEDGDCG